MLCYVTSISPPYETTTSSAVFPPSFLTSDHMWGVRSLKGSECEQNVWNSPWSVLDRDLLKSHFLHMFPWRRHFTMGEGLKQSLHCILPLQNAKFRRFKTKKKINTLHECINVTHDCFYKLMQLKRWVTINSFFWRYATIALPYYQLYLPQLSEFGTCN